MIELTGVEDGAQPGERKPPLPLSVVFVDELPAVSRLLLLELPAAPPPPPPFAYPASCNGARPLLEACVEGGDSNSPGMGVTPLPRLEGVERGARDDDDNDDDEEEEYPTGCGLNGARGDDVAGCRLVIKEDGRRLRGALPPDKGEREMPTVDDEPFAIVVVVEEEEVEEEGATKEADVGEPPFIPCCLIGLALGLKGNP